MRPVHKMDKKFDQFGQGFTLVELLVAIAIIGLIVGLALPNFLGARERARDAKKKGELNELKTALRLYYTDYQSYPGANGINLAACGQNGDQACPVCGSAEFAAGGTDGCSSVYMKKLPKDSAGANAFSYYYYSNGDDFRLSVNLENASDADITASQSRCPKSSGVWGVKEYIVCAD